MTDYTPRRREVRVLIRRGFPFIPSASAISPRGNWFYKYGFTRKQAKRRLLNEIGAIPMWPANSHVDDGRPTSALERVRERHSRIERVRTMKAAGYSTPEIADAIGIRPSNVQSILRDLEL